MSTLHLLDREGAVWCGATPREDGSNVTSEISNRLSCSDCLTEAHLDSTSGDARFAYDRGEYAPVQKAARKVVAAEKALRKAVEAAVHGEA